MTIEFYLLSTILAALLVIGTGSSALGWLREHGCRQHIRTDGPERHLGKSGTPTMGGVLFVPVAVLVGLLIPLLLGKWNPQLLLLAGLTLSFMLVGLADDALMLKRKGSLGLKARHKLLLQFAFAALFLYVYSRMNPLPVMRIPFTLTLLDPLSPFLYYPFAFLLIVGGSNATNLSDGLDGLLAGMSAIAAAAFALIAAWLNLYDLALFSCAILGACIGFLFYNRHPAQVFMGDTGSLALGAALSGIAVLLHAEIFLLLLGAVFFIEMLSVIIQVIVFKRTGRRVFKMSPLHHHFELSGWKETRVVKVFWTVSAVITAVTLLGTRVGWRL